MMADRRGSGRDDKNNKAKKLRTVYCSFWRGVHVLTLLCRSRKALLLGSGLSFSWRQWHLCDRGFLGYVFLHWLLHSHLEEKGVGVERMNQIKLQLCGKCTYTLFIAIWQNDSFYVHV